MKPAVAVKPVVAMAALLQARYAAKLLKGVTRTIRNAVRGIVTEEEWETRTAQAVIDKHEGTMGGHALREAADWFDRDDDQSGVGEALRHRATAAEKPKPKDGDN